MPEPSPKGEKTFRGIPVSAGVCRGKILVLDRGRPAISRRQLSDGEVAEEVNRLEKALVQTRHQILEVQRKVSAGMGAKEGSIFDAHLLVLEDQQMRVKDAAFLGPPPGADFALHFPNLAPGVDQG